MNEFVLVSLVYVALAVMFIVLGRMGRDGSLAPNDLFGIRTNTTLGSDAAWYSVHRDFAPWSFRAAGISLAAALLVLAAPGPAMQATVLLLLTGGVIAVVVRGSWAAHRSFHRTGGANPNGASPRR